MIPVFGEMLWPAAAVSVAGGILLQAMPENSSTRSRESTKVEPSDMPDLNS